MQSKPPACSMKVPRSAASIAIAAALVALALPLTGCTSSLQKHSVALATATAPVVDQAAAAYRAAEELHDVRVDYDAVAEFDSSQAVYNPRNIQPLLSSKDIDIRLAVLTAFQCYVRSLVDITNGVESPSLEAASQSVGSSLSSLGNTFSSSFQSAFGVTPTSTTQTTVTSTSTGTTTNSSSTSDVISSGARNGISTAVNALGLYLVGRKIKAELPQVVIKMDPNVEALCQLLEKDIDVIESQEKLDYNSIINSQTLFIRQSQAAAANPLSPQDRREQIMKLPQIVRQQRQTEAELADLRAAIVRLALTHHAFAAEAQGNNPESLKLKLSELSAAGNDLGKFYSSLPTQ
jgi:hypothetical protein